VIDNRQLWRLLWGPLIYLGESRHILNQLPQLLNWLNLRGLQDFLTSVQQVSLLLEMVSGTSGWVFEPPNY
jgi:hypothetical protein